jgi:hypothetical protein
MLMKEKLNWKMIGFFEWNGRIALETEDGGVLL